METQSHGSTALMCYDSRVAMQKSHGLVAMAFLSYCFPYNTVIRVFEVIFDLLTVEKKSELTVFIKMLQGKDILNLCSICHDTYGCGHEHSFLLYDNGKCSICGNMGKVVNCAIANKVVRDGIDLIDYWREGKKLT